MSSRKQSAKSTTAIGKTSKGFTDEERAAMKERARELKAAARRGPRAGNADGESDVLAKIAEMPEPDRAMAAYLVLNFCALWKTQCRRQRRGRRDRPPLFALATLPLRSIGSSTASMRVSYCMPSRIGMSFA